MEVEMGTEQVNLAKEGGLGQCIAGLGFKYSGLHFKTQK